MFLINAGRRASYISAKRGSIHERLAALEDNGGTHHLGVREFIGEVNGCICDSTASAHAHFVGVRAAMGWFRGCGAGQPRMDLPRCCARRSGNRRSAIRLGLRITRPSLAGDAPGRRDATAVGGELGSSDDQ